MALVHRHGFVTFGVTDLEKEVEFFTAACRLVVRERRDGEVFLTGDSSHHWLRLVQRDEPGLIRLGFQAVDRDAVAEIIQRLSKHGIAWTDGGNLADDRVSGGVRFRDPFGIEIEVYEEMLDVPGPAVDDDAGLVELLHAVAFVSDVEAARDFYVDVLDLRRSDQIEQLVVFLRAGNGYHHALGLARGESGRLDHLAILVRDLDAVMRLRLQAMRLGVLGDDVVRHAASGSISVYLRDETAGIGVEFCTGHQRIDDDSFAGRMLKASPSTVNMWDRPFTGADLQPATAAAPTGGTEAARLASQTADGPGE